MVKAQAEVTAVDGRKETFSIQAWDTHERIGEATHTRLIVDIERFMSRVEAKQGN